MDEFRTPAWQEQHEGAVLLNRRGDRARWVVEGRAPERMLTGSLSERMPPARSLGSPAGKREK